MPLRRRPSAPSERVQAILATARQQPGQRSSGLEPWLPERDWIAGADLPTPANEAPVRVPGEGPPGRHRRPMPGGPRFLTVPLSLRGARLTGSRAAVAGLLAVVLVAAAGFGVRVAWARAASAPQVVAPTQGGSALGVRGQSSGGFASTPTSAGGGGPPTGVLTVHVVGQVRRPGVFQLPPGARVSDAVAKAGGARSPADLAAINLARPLTDGEQIRVPRPGEVVQAAPGAPGTGGSSGAAGASGGGGAGGKLNLNTATAAQLEDLPGVGPVLAKRIVDWRTQHGRFTAVDELGEVSGIGEKIFGELAPRVTV